MDNDRDDTRRLKEYKAYKEELEKKLETEKNDQQITWFKARLRSENVEYLMLRVI